MWASTEEIIIGKHLITTVTLLRKCNVDLFAKRKNKSKEKKKFSV